MAMLHLAAVQILEVQGSISSRHQIILLRTMEVIHRDMHRPVLVPIHLIHTRMLPGDRKINMVLGQDREDLSKDLPCRASMDSSSTNSSKHHGDRHRDMVVP
jgi:hypothetical protein